NNVPGSSPFNINLLGQSLSYGTDSDGDGMSDASEYDLTAKGFSISGQTFNWQVSQPALVTAYYAGASEAGLYNQTQYAANFNAGQAAVTNSPNSYGLYTGTQYNSNGALNLATGITIGQSNVTNNPNAYGLYSQTQYDGNGATNLTNGIAIGQS